MMTRLAKPESDWLVYSHLTHSTEDLEAIRDFAVVHPETGGGSDW